MTVHLLTTPVAPNWSLQTEHLSIERSPRRRSPDDGVVLDANDVRAIAVRALAQARNGRPTERCRHELEAIDRTARFTKAALRLFQDLQARLGLRTIRPVLLPLNNQPFWQRGVAAC